MSGTGIIDRLMTWEDLEVRWQPPMTDAAKRKRWVKATATRWRLRPMKGTRGKTARFRHADVVRAEEFAATGRK